MCKYTHCKSGTVRAVCQTGSAVTYGFPRNCFAYATTAERVAFVTSFPEEDVPPVPGPPPGPTPLAVVAFVAAAVVGACLSCLCRLLGCRCRPSCLAFARIRLYCSAVGSLRCFGRLFGSCRGFCRPSPAAVWFPLPSTLPRLSSLPVPGSRSPHSLPVSVFFFSFLLLFLSYGNCLFKVYLCRNIIFIHISDQIDYRLKSWQNRPLLRSPRYSASAERRSSGLAL